jgi:hypothetical protein
MLLLTPLLVLQDELRLLRKANKCLLCHTLTANTALEPCGCRFCSSCLMQPVKGQSNGAKDRQHIQCPSCDAPVNGAVKLLRPTGLETEASYRAG